MQEITTRAPGRINIIGEHIDYHGGFVLPAAIGCEVEMTVCKNGSLSEVNAVAKDLSETFSFNLQDYKPVQSGWPNYIMGVFHELEKLGAQIEGCDLSFKSTVPIGAGMSSSAAIECSLALALNELFDLRQSKTDLIKASQMAEHNFVGIKCGIMDQFASMMGRADSVILLDCQSLEYQYFDLKLGEYQLLLLNSNVSHELATSEYNDRRETSEKGMQILKSLDKSIDSFRDISVDLLKDGKSLMNDLMYRRCRHVVSEIQRTKDACRALEFQNLNELGKIIYHGHDSLQHDYEVTCPETDFLVDFTRDKSYILGARQMGGGFGGCTINLIRKEQVYLFTKEIDLVYQKKFEQSATPYIMDIADGASIISSQ